MIAHTKPCDVLSKTLIKLAHRRSCGCSGSRPPQWSGIVSKVHLVKSVRRWPKMLTDEPHKMLATQVTRSTTAKSHACVTAVPAEPRARPWARLGWGLKGGIFFALPSHFGSRSTVLTVYMYHVGRWRAGLYALNSERTITNY